MERRIVLVLNAEILSEIVNIIKIPSYVGKLE